ncbi:hypothetical protein AXG55_02820 [Silvanigrella aquatica]|uniref:Uncharacterized protein n=2 Tax=Silvanigrella aquatica TaxID=1915309 RepID=A0A1L4CY85_9BACT|nr:hypothetical protein AXG55_02820 [Silvanigrella aquatica]
MLDETMILFENNENNFNQEKIEKNLSDIKEFIQIDFKIGNHLAPIDIYLFLNGIVNDDIYALQSLLSQNENQQLPIHISKHINYSSAKKLAFALKENRISLKTKVNVKINKENKSCELYINGHNFKNKLSFETPAGIPIYTAVYCLNNTYQVQKIHPSESQTNLNVVFNEFVERKNKPDFLPNPLKSQYDLPIKSNGNEELNKNEIKNEELAERNIKFVTGVGVLKDFGTLKNYKLRNLNFPEGTLFYSTSSFQYKYFLLQFDYARIKFQENLEISYQNSLSNQNNKIQSSIMGGGVFIRPGMGLRSEIFSFSDSFALEGGILVNSLFLNGEYHSFNQAALGLQSHLGLACYLGSGFLFKLQLGTSYLFGKLQGLQVDSQVLLGYSF